ncbi:hypothetical protein EAO73_13685 [Streptomyces sp. col6]|nr:hypothetical protein EAO73_13685 [Streptomyces sp. col6]
MAEQGPLGDGVVQVVGERAAAQSFQQVPTRFGQDVTPGELLAESEIDRGDVEGGERHVRGRIHPRPHRRRPQAWHFSRRPSISSCPERRITKARHHANSCARGFGFFFAGRVSCAGRRPKASQPRSPGRWP